MDTAGQQDVTVSRGPRRGEDCDGAASARAIFDNQPIGKLLAKDGRDWASEAVDPSTRTVRHDNFDDPVRPFGRNRIRCLNGSQDDGREPDQPLFCY
jgi:hypothetical protein